MKTAVYPLFTGKKIFLFVGLFFLLAFQSISNNPLRSNFLTNLSGSVNPEALDDVAAEMQISGNTIHTVWIEYKYGAESPLYYCRSTDLGKTWETPKLIGKLKDSQYAKQPTTRKLAVDGNNIHIAWCDYAYYENGTGRIYYSKSTNGGSSFDEAKEIVSTGGGYKNISASMIKASNGKVAIAYRGYGAKNGLRMLFSGDNGNLFTDKLITEEPDNLSDFWYDGNQMIVVSEYIYYYFGLNVGKVFVSISNDDAANFTTQKISSTFNESPTIVREKCRCYHDVHYSPKIAKSGNNIHIVFVGYNEKIEWTVLYTRSTDNGLNFEKPRDVNNATLNGNYMQSGQETVVAKNGHVYLAYLSTGAKLYFLQSKDDGTSFSPTKLILPEGITFVETTWWPSLVLDPNDNSGSNLYIAGQSMFSFKTTDGGENFSQSIVAAPFLNSNLRYILSDMAIDGNGNKHWISEAMFKGGTDHDIIYKSIMPQPEPGSTNKALSIETLIFDKFETAIVPSSPTLDFDSAMTAEAWVKFDPKTDNIINILAKVNGYDGYDYTPNGYQLGFRYGSGKFCINSGIETDKGDFVNWGDCSIADTLWHHVAFTYNASAGLNNFKTYVDGLLSVQQTVTGRVIPGNGLLMIGSRQAYYGTTKYQVDNIRLWNRALSQEELLENQVKTFSGQEEGLKLFLNFDDTFRDISGNGNDAIPVYLGILKNSDFNPPVSRFDIYQNNNQVALTNKSQNGKSYNWRFGDSSVSDKGNPVYTYPNAGEYIISLEAANQNSKTASIKRVTISGIDRVEPTSAGNIGISSFKVFGGGVDKNTTIKLEKNGQVILADSISFLKNGEINVRFDLDGIAVGKWNLIAKIGNTDHTLKDAITIESGKVADPYIYISGRTTVLLNRWFAKTIEFGNQGNVDIYNVPLYIAVSDIPGLEVEFINVDFRINEFSQELGHQELLKSTPLSFIREGFFPDGEDAVIYPIIVPTLSQGSSQTIMLRIKSPTNYKLDAWIYGFAAQNELKSTRTDNLNLFGNCLKDAVIGNLYTAAGIATSLALTALPVGCVKQTFDTAYGTTKNIYTGESGKTTLWSALWDFTSLAVNCAGDLYPPAKAYQAALTIAGGLMDLYSTAQSYYDCSKYIRYKDRVFTVSSFDPNEMIGPSGYSDKHYIQKNNMIPYTILFENKSTATAPAHQVFVTDTLDLSKFDIKEFGFGAFGFGDTIMAPNGKKLKEFSMDVDLTPKMNLIARVSGKLDTISGVIKWEFLSLNPTSLLDEEDPFIGFLPPNNDNRDGEGFVSFSVALKEELGTNDVLKNQATIVFDANAPILTNEYVNTLDLDKPLSQIYPLDATNKNNFPLAWTGSDNGSGIASYSIYVMQNDTALRPWLLNTELKSAEFIGDIGSTYKFYSVATDNVSLTEDTPSQYDASTQIIVHVEEFEKRKDELQVFPNPAKDLMTVSLANAPCGMYVLELVGMNGQALYSEIHDDFSLSKGVGINLTGVKSGQYLIRLVYGNKTETRKVMIR